jgi:hypothetical protein
MASPTIPKVQGPDTCRHGEFWLRACDLVLGTLCHEAFALIGMGLKADIWSDGSFFLRGKKPTCIDSISSRNVACASVIALKPATCGQFKTGHFGWPET